MSPTGVKLWVRPQETEEGGAGGKVRGGRERRRVWFDEIWGGPVHPADPPAVRCSGTPTVGSRDLDADSSVVLPESVPRGSRPRVCLASQGPSPSPPSSGTLTSRQGSRQGTQAAEAPAVQVRGQGGSRARPSNPTRPPVPVLVNVPQGLPDDTRRTATSGAGTVISSWCPGRLLRLPLPGAGDPGTPWSRAPSQLRNGRVS